MSNFPKDVFEDVPPSKFGKHNKTGVSEDYATENFKELGWECFRQFDDTGIDLVARKLVCPDNHTAWNCIEKDEECQKCNKKLITITRFIQVKTREKDDGNKLGYTLDTADFRTDPRHVFLIYSDATRDFLIIGMKDYLDFFTKSYDLGAQHFGTPSFRYENNRIHNLRYEKNSKKLPKFYWQIGRGKKKQVYSWDIYLNEKGLKKMSNPDFDLNLVTHSTYLAKKKMCLFHSYRSGEEIYKNVLGTTKPKLKKSKADQKRLKSHENSVKKFLKKKLSTKPPALIKMRQKNKKTLYNKIKKQDKSLVDSVNKAWERFRGLNFGP